MTIKTLVLLAIIALLFFACQNKGSSASEGANAAAKKLIYERVDNATFKSKLAQEDAIILDVRTKRETDQGVIGDATLIDFRSPDFAAKVAELPRDKTYLLYCQSGGRSAKAAKMMQGMGFEEIYELKNGYGSWKD